MSGSLSARSPSDVTDTEYFNPNQSTPSAVYSLLDSVDSESIADDYKIGRHSATHDFENHVKIGIREGLDPSDSLEELAQTTDSADELDYMAGSTFSRYTNDRDYGAVVRLLSEMLHTRRLYHQRGVQRKRLPSRAVVPVYGSTEVLIDIRRVRWRLILSTVLSTRISRLDKRPLSN